MHHRRRLRHTLATLGVLTTVATGTALAAAPVAAAPASAPAAHFVVLGPRGGPLQTTSASVRDAGGTVIQSWPQIGVLIVRSTRPGFAAAVREMPGVSGAGASRNLVERQHTPAVAVTAQHDPAGFESVQTVQPTAAAAASAAGDPLSVEQWDMRLIKADLAHAVSGGSRNVVVGVLDSGVDAVHPDLRANVDAADSVGCTNQGIPDTSRAAWSPTGIAHGTHVAGTIAAARNGIGIVGVAPNVRIASIKVVDNNGFIYPEYAICGFVWAAEHHISVTNNSYFVDPWFLWCGNDPDQRAGAEAVRRAIDYSAKHDVLNIAALGNANWNLSKPIIDTGSPDNGTPIDRRTGGNCTSLPTEIPGVVGVSAVGAAAKKSFYSNYGASETEVAAPGGDTLQRPETPDGSGAVLSTVPGGGYAYLQGTSMASPHAVGVAALIRSTHPGWSAKQVASALARQADRLACPQGEYDPTGDGRWAATCTGGPSGRGFYGHGLVDALHAVTR